MVPSLVLPHKTSLYSLNLGTTSAEMEAEGRSVGPSGDDAFHEWCYFMIPPDIRQAVYCYYHSFYNVLEQP